MVMVTFRKVVALVKRKRYDLAMVLTKAKEKIKTMRTSRANKQTINRAYRRQALPLRERNDIIGVLLVLFCAGTAYSSIAVWFNISTVGIVPKLMLLPQIVACAGIIIWKFTKR